MKDNFFFMDEYFLGIEFRYPSQQVEPPMLWFKPENFRKVIAVCKKNGLGIHVIEVYKNGYADTLISDDFGGNPYDSNWYANEYENLVKKYCSDEDTTEVLFAGWYLEPGDVNEVKTDSPNAIPHETTNQTISNKKSFWSRIKDWF